MCDIIILGLLRYRIPFTSYDIKKAMDKSTNLFMATSYGTINPCLKKLLKEGFITSYEDSSNNRKKIYYTITDSGLKEFKRLIGKNLFLDKNRQPELLTIFNFDIFTYEEKIERLDLLISGNLELRKELIEAYESLEIQLNSSELPSDIASSAVFKLDTLRFGIDYHDFVVNWYVSYKNKLCNEIDKSDGDHV